MTGGTKKIVTWLAIAFVAFYLVTNPQGASSVIQGVVGFIGEAFDSLITFFTELF